MGYRERIEELAAIGHILGYGPETAPLWEKLGFTIKCDHILEHASGLEICLNDGSYYGVSHKDCCFTYRVEVEKGRKQEFWDEMQRIMSPM